MTNTLRQVMDKESSNRGDLPIFVAGFGRSPNVSDAYVIALAGALGQARTVRLNFYGCSKLTDASVTRLAEALGQATTVSLNFEGCYELTDASEARLKNAVRRRP